MADFKVEQLRNVVLLGHGSSGKTSLSEALLFQTKAISRLGRVEDKNTVSDFDEEEQSRGFSVNTAILPCNWQGQHINILDAPGYMDFVGEVRAAIHAADSAVVVICAASGVEVGAEVQWNVLEEGNKPRMIFVNKMDRDNASFEQVLTQLGQKFDKTFVPIQIPIGSQSELAGVVDLIKMKAYLGAKNVEAEIPASMQDAAETARMEMMEYAAEIDDELMLKYLDGEELSDTEVRAALAEGSKSGNLVLVLAGAATQQIGTSGLLDAMVSFMPSPAEVEIKATDKSTGEQVTLAADPAGPLVAQVFKTMADPFVGKLTYFRVYSGTFSSDSRVLNVNKGEEERVGQLFAVRGKEQTPVPSIRAGDMGAVAKLTETVTNDTLCDKGAPYLMPLIDYPEPLSSVSVFPKSKADLDKLGSSMQRLLEEDPTLRMERNTETNESILSGMGESHIQIATRRLAQKFGVEVETDLPTIPYRETITKTSQAQGRHKKQSGGRGQFGDVWCRFEPRERGEGFEFASEVFGGSVPKNYIPAVEKGMLEVMGTGVLAGFPTVDFKCVLYDGSYHQVDSSELAFKLAAHIAFHDGIPAAGPVLLEPVYTIRVVVPENFMGDILGDLNTRRARIQGMSQERGNGVVEAEVPLAEIQRYATELRSMTQGRGIYTQAFSHYGVVPAHLVDKIREEAGARREAAAERQ